MVAAWRKTKAEFGGLAIGKTVADLRR